MVMEFFKSLAPIYKKAKGRQSGILQSSNPVIISYLEKLHYFVAHFKVYSIFSPDSSFIHRRGNNILTASWYRHRLRSTDRCLCSGVVLSCGRGGFIAALASLKKWNRAPCYMDSEEEQRWCVFRDETGPGVSSCGLSSLLKNSSLLCAGEVTSSFSTNTFLFFLSFSPFCFCLLWLSSCGQTCKILPDSIGNARPHPVFV
ncbi:uncharacterized protein LOC130554537 isoform X1 [Triplophysa rosa]|uniref:uncharacterized protein LOC130554537 isoform X1 n=1 Tax=Triplophysa rosa TaxID=992332 RepID=UPI002545CC58|nr:uncharacterized protein LOC130554537 isoform X1 [Triplophysa rosa]